MTNKAEFAVLKDSLWLERQKKAAQATKECLLTFLDLTLNVKSLNLLDIEKACEQIIAKHNCTPTFYQYKGFPGKVCLSVNNTLVHGIPTDLVLKPGDVVSLDLGATFEGAIADTALTSIVGGKASKEIVDMVIACQGALDAGCGAVKVGNNLGHIGFSIFESVKDTPYGVIVDYGGHGINYDTPHAFPFVLNKSKKDQGIPIVEGLSIAIEPMLTLKKNVNTRILGDKWSVNTKDIGCHFEHSVTVDESGVTHVVTEHGISIKDHLEAQ